MKQDLQDEFQEDQNKVRGALREILTNNRSINNDLVEQMVSGDMSLIEEYNLLVKNILDASKILTDLNSQAPKTVKDIQSIKDQKVKIDLDSLMDSEDSESEE